MKKIAFVLSMILCSFASLAQNDVKVRFGVEAGFNMSKWDGDYKDFLGTSFKPGFNLGGLAEIQINQKWSVQPELLVSMEGTKTDGGVKTFCAESDNPLYFSMPDEVSAIYLKVPIFVYYSFHNVGPGRLSPGLGLYLAWGIAGKTNEIRTFSSKSFFQESYDAIADDYEQRPQDYSSSDVKNKDLWYNCIPRSFDYGVGFKCMYEMEKKCTGLFGTVGILEGLTGAYNLNIQVSVGYKWQYNKWLRSKYNTGILEYNP